MDATACARGQWLKEREERAAVLGDEPGDGWDASGGPETERRSREDFSVDGLRIMTSNSSALGYTLRRPQVPRLQPLSASCVTSIFFLLRKSSAYHFYNKLARQTDTQCFPASTRYVEFRRMTRQWRHLQMLKRGPQAHR
ncbi:hypothetical protein B0H14DRAFT_3506103 [Mycena olivaceomarginata]|nr:hypothetical protein B0H14DRAFT_3506103 [Mycena olivaceomarginata]